MRMNIYIYIWFEIDFSVSQEKKSLFYFDLARCEGITFNVDTSVSTKNV
jgi:hypothetical protein